MSRETDWHVFDRACDVTAMALRGTADDLAAGKVAELFNEVHGALRTAAADIEGAGTKAGF